jgi:hypothetical protein
MIFQNKEAERLYALWPDLLYAHPDGTWYAMYHDDKCILTNANKKIRAYKYRTKADYKDVREIIIRKYNLRPAKIKTN